MRVIGRKAVGEGDPGDKVGVRFVPVGPGLISKGAEGLGVRECEVNRERVACGLIGVGALGLIHPRGGVARRRVAKRGREGQLPRLRLRAL